MTTTKTAIRTLLGSDATYKSLLSSSSPYKTFYIWAPQPPDYPYVVYRLRPGRANQDLGNEAISVQYDLVFMIWGQQGDNYEAIADRIKKVLHQKYDSIGNHFILTGESGEIYDEETNAYGLTLTFNLVYRGGL